MPYSVVASRIPVSLAASSIASGTPYKRLRISTTAGGGRIASQTMHPWPWLGRANIATAGEGAELASVSSEIEAADSASTAADAGAVAEARAGGQVGVLARGFGNRANAPDDDAGLAFGEAVMNWPLRVVTTGR